jgi:hypothetical protein
VGQASVRDGGAKVLDGSCVAEEVVEGGGSVLLCLCVAQFVPPPRTDLCKVFDSGDLFERSLFGCLENLSVLTVGLFLF